MSLLAQDERLTRRVGGITLLLLAAAITFFVVIAPRIEWGRQVRIRVYFHQSGGLVEGSPLMLAGQPVGKVESIARSPHGAPGPLNGDEGVVVTVAIEADEAARIARGGDVFVAANGALSARYLEFGPSPKPEAPTLADVTPQTNEFLGVDTPTLDRVLQRTWDNLTTAKQFADDIGPEVAALRDQLRKLAKTMDELAPNIGGVASLGIEIDGLMEQVRQLRDVALGGEDGLERFAAMIKHARATIAQTRSMLDVLGAKGRALSASVDALGGRLGKRGPAALHQIELAIERVRAAADKLDPLLAKIDEINDRIARGEGSLGKLARDPEFPEDAKELGKILKRQPWKIIARPKD